MQELLNAILGWVVGKILDFLLDRWRNRKVPLTDSQVRRFHITHLAIAILLFVWVTVLTLYAGMGLYASPHPTAIDFLIVAALVLLLAYLSRVVRRRWRRQRENAKWWESRKRA